MPTKTMPPQKQKEQPGKEFQMKPQPQSKMENYRPADKLKNKVAIITGGDSGIGRAVSIAFAKEGADCVIVYLEEHKDAEETKKIIEDEGRKAIAISGDIGESDFCKEVIRETVDEFGRIDVLVNNAAEQHVRESVLEIPDNELLRTFKTNIFSMFYMIREAVKYMPKGSTIINTTSITAYKGHKVLLDYSATKGAIVTLTRSLALALGPDIRVNAVAPGPIWTPLIPATFEEEKVETFGSDTVMQRPGQPDEVAPSYVFLASNDSSYMTGQVLHPDGGKITNT